MYSISVNFLPLHFTYAPSHIYIYIYIYMYMIYMFPSTVKNMVG